MSGHASQAIHSLSWVYFLWFAVRQAQATRKAYCNGWALKAPDEGDLTCNPTGEAAPGTECRLRCDTGFRPKHEVLLCSETGGWVPTNTPECEADTTMTLVIVLSIVGSIILIFSLSVLYARTSKRCQGKRRKLDDEDPETGLRRKEVPDISTYYGRVQRLRRKRRQQAERQRQRAARAAQTEKPVTKQPTSTPPKDDAKRSKKRRRSDEDVKKGTAKSRSKGKQARPKEEKDRKRGKQLRRKSTQKVAQKKSGPKKNISECMRSVFCVLCDSLSNNKNKRKKLIPQKKSSEDDVKVFSISENPKPRRRLESSSSSSSDTTSSSSSSSSASSSSSSESSSEDEKETTKKPIEKKKDDTETPAARAKKPPQKPPPPTKKRPPPPTQKKPPPRPPAPKFLSNISQGKSKKKPTSSDQTDASSSEEGSLHGQVRNPIMASSGYSSEGDRQRRTRGHNESGAGRKSNNESSGHHKTPASHSGKPAARSPAKRMEILSQGDAKTEPVTGNPYENYPAALSYRQYHDFENDYRRTTGEYRPQYNNVQLIPLQSVKKDDKKQKHEEGEEDTEQEIKETKSVVGGIKYISISEEETDSESSESDDEERRPARKHQRRYEDPSDRDRRRHSLGNDPRTRAARHGKKHREESPRSKSAAQRDRKRQIEGETIIDDGKRTKMRNDKKHSRKKRDSDKQSFRKGREDRKGDDAKSGERSKHKKRPHSDSKRYRSDEE